MDILDRYVYSINFDNTILNLDREHSPYFCNPETPKMPDLNTITNNNSFEFSQAFNPGLTLDKYFGGNFKAIKLQDLEVDDTFDIYTKNRKLAGKNKSCHCRNDSRMNISGMPSDLSMELISEKEETPLKEIRKTMINTKKNQENVIKQGICTEIDGKSGDRSFRLKKTTFKRTVVHNNKSMSPCAVKEDKHQKENIEKTPKVVTKEREMQKSYQLQQLLKRENPENHITFRKISYFVNKKNNLTKNDPMAEYTDLGLSKNIGKIKQIEKKTKEFNKEINDNKDNALGNSYRIGGGAENIAGFGRNKGYSRRELSKKLVSKKN